MIGADRRLRIWLAILGGNVLALIPSRIRADQSAAVTLTWQTPADAQCATGAQMRERVARLTERPLVLRPGAGDHRIHAIVSPNGSTWQATVTLLDNAGHRQAVRTVEGRTPNCGSVDVAAAVVIATMLDGLPGRAPVREEVAEPATATDAGVQFGAFVAASSGLIPRAWFGGGVEVLFGFSIPVLIEATVYGPAAHEDALGRGASLWGFHGGAGICPQVFAGGGFDLGLCASAQAGVQFASGIGLTRSDDSNLPIVLLKLGPRFRSELTEALSLQLGVSAAWVVVRPRVHWEIEGEPRRELRSDLIALLGQIGFVISME